MDAKCTIQDEIINTWLESEHGIQLPTQTKQRDNSSYETTENKVNKSTYPALEAILVLLRNKYIVWRLQSGCPPPVHSIPCDFERIIIVNSITLNVRQNICQCENSISAICERLCVRQFMHEHNDVR